MMGEERRMIGITTSQSWIAGEVDSENRVHGSTPLQNESRQALVFDMSTVLGDRWQTGVQLPFSRRDRTESGERSFSAGIGDISLRAAYEFLPEWNYSRWMPKGFLIGQIGIPSGPSAFDEGDSPAAIRGRGYWNPSFGVALSKTWTSWDALLVTEMHTPLSRSREIGTSKFQFMPSAGFSALTALGYSWGEWRLGASFSFLYDGPIALRAVASGAESPGEPQWLGTAGLSAHWLIAESVTLGLLYFDSAAAALAFRQPIEQRVAFVLQVRELR